MLHYRRKRALSDRVVVLKHIALPSSTSNGIHTQQVEAHTVRPRRLPLKVSSNSSAMRLISQPMRLMPELLSPTFIHTPPPPPARYSRLLTHDRSQHRNKDALLLEAFVPVCLTIDTPSRVNTTNAGIIPASKMHRQPDAATPRQKTAHGGPYHVHVVVVAIQ